MEGQGDRDRAFWSELTLAVDAYLATEDAPHDLRDAMHVVLASRPFKTTSERPMSEIVKALKERFPGVSRSFLMDHADCIPAMLACKITAHNTRVVIPATTAGNDGLDRSELRRAFEKPFQGAAHERLFRHLIACRDRFFTFSGIFVFPCFAIVQSSGFGKSRLLRELASTIAKREFDRGKLHMQVVYLCARDGSDRTRYPPTTEALRDYFFQPSAGDEEMKVDALAHKLLALFEVVMTAPWGPMQETLMKRFEGKDCDLTEKLIAHKFLSSVAPDASARLLVLAVDDARSLLPPSSSGSEDSLGRFGILRRALKGANNGIRKRFGPNSALMAIVVDTSWRFSKVVPPVETLDPDMRYSTDYRYLDPFVLTETMDIAINCSTPSDGDVYKRVVLEATSSVSAIRSGSWRTLLQFGRPLWAWGLRSTITINKEGVIRFAAQKLLGETKYAFPEQDMREANHYGVASLLCRLGVRPYSGTKLASRVVADFMAVLSHVNYKHDQIICSYSSDPVLALGATYLWHNNHVINHNETLSTFARKMLPELRRLLLEETLDTGGVSGLVARVVLLLAMDASAVLETRKQSARWEEAGSFMSVWSFLRRCMAIRLSFWW